MSAVCNITSEMACAQARGWPKLPRMLFGDGNPNGQEVGYWPNDQYLDELTGILYTFNGTPGTKIGWAAVSGMINVLSLGAVGDGITDDTTAVQEALDRAKETSGTVFFPSGTFVTSSLTLSGADAVTITGFGATLKSSTSTILSVIESTRIRIVGLNIEGLIAPGSVAGFPGTQRGIALIKTSDSTVEYCSVRYCSAQGIMVTCKASDGTYDPSLSHTNTIRNNFVDWCSQGIVFFSGVNGCLCDGNTVNRCYSVGIFIDDISGGDTEDHICYSIKVTSNFLTRNIMNGTTGGAAISVAGSNSILIIGNYISESGQETYDGDVNNTSYGSGIIIQSGQSDYVTNRVLIFKNTIEKCARFGVSLGGVVDSEVKGNWISNCGYRKPVFSQEAIQLTKTTAMGTVIPGGPGTTQGSNSNYISGNVIIKDDADSDMTYGVFVRDSDCVNNVIEDEDYKGIVTSAINDLGTNTRKLDIFLDDAQIYGRPYGFPLFNSGPIQMLACISDGGSNVNVPGVHWAGAGLVPTSTFDSPNVSIQSDFIELTASIGMGVFVDTRTAKKFFIQRNVFDSASGGRIGVRCYDSSGNVLTNIDPNHPYVTGSINLSYNSAFGGCYRTGTDSNSPVEIEVNSDVAKVAILVLQVSGNVKIRNFTIHSLDDAFNLTLGDAYKAMVWSGYEDVVRGANIGTTPPASGTWVQGRIVFNNSPSAGGDIGWVCVSGGTPGTWKSFGSIAP